MSLDLKPLPEGVALSLTTLEGEEKELRYQISYLPAYIGTGPDMDVVLSGKDVAPYHARLVGTGQDCFIEDLGSGKPTRLNDRKVKRARVANGDIIEIGEVKLLLQLSIRPAAASESVFLGGADVDKTLPQQIWSAGFDEDFREWMEHELSRELEVETTAFRTGEEAIVALSRALSGGRPPGLLILDLRLPLINGINVAIALRALELGYRREDHVPIVFLFDPPESTSFEKVVKFCQPLKILSPGNSTDGARQATIDIVRKVLSGQAGNGLNS